MAETNAPFVITTELDLTGINAGLGKLTAVLRKYDPKASPLGKTTGKDVKGIKANTNALIGFGSAQDEANGKVKTGTDHVKKFNKQLKGTKNTLTDVSRRVFIWGSMAAVIFGALQNLKDFYQLTLDVNTALAELKKVLPRDTDFSGMKMKAFDLSIEFGVEPLDVLKLFKRFGQAGLSAEHVISATKTALLALNTTGAETEKVFNAIIATNKLFNVSFAESEQVIDKIMRIQADFAIDAKDLIDSITGIGPAIQVLGGDLDDLFGNIAALGEIARVSGKEASNTLKRVFPRIVSKEGIKVLNDMGIAVYATADSYRPLRSILKEISIAFESASDVEKQNLSVTLAQIRQYSKFQALLVNYLRASEAIEKSEKASGDAFRANQDVLDTYAKQSMIAGNKIKQLAENIISSNGGIADAITRTKITVGDFASFMNTALNPSITSSAISLGALYLGTKGIKAVLPKVATSTKKVALAQLHLAKNTKKLNRIFVGHLKYWNKTIPAITKWTLGLGAAAAAMVIFSGVYELFTRDQRRRNRIIAESIQKLGDWKKGLEEIDFINIGKANVEEKFNALTAILDKFSEGKVNSINDVVDAFSELFYGTGRKNLTAEQLKELYSRLQSLDKMIGGTILAPFTEAVGKFKADMTTPIKELKDIFGELKISEKLKTKFGEEKLNSALIQGRRFGFPSVDLKIEEGEYMSPKFFKKLKQINAITSSWRKTLLIPNIPEQELANYGKTIISSVRNIEKLQEALDKLTDSNNKLTEAEQKQKGALENQIKGQAVKVADSILELAQFRQVLEAAAKDAGIADSKAYKSYKGVKEAKAFAEVQKVLSQRIDEMAISMKLSKVQAAQYQEALKNLLTLDMWKKSTNSQKLFSIALDLVSFISGFKKTTFSVMSGFAGEIEAIAELGKIDLSGVFNVNDQTLSVIDSTIKSVLENIRSSAKEISALDIELVTTNSLLKKSVDYVFDDSDERGAINDKVNSINTALIRQKKIMESEKNELGSMFELLTKAKKVVIEYVATEKGYQKLLEDRSGLIENVLKAQLDINKIKFSNPFEAFKADITIYDKITELQKENAKILMDVGYLEAEKGATLLAELDAQQKINKLLYPVEALQKRIEKGYERIESIVSGISGSFEDLLANQEQFLENLSSSGGLKNILNNLGSGITSAFAGADAKIISEAIGGKTKDAFVSGNKELLKLIDDLNDASRNAINNSLFTDAIENAHKNGLNAANELIKLGFTDGARIFTSKIKEAVPDIVDALYSHLSAKFGIDKPADTLKGGSVDKRYDDLIKKAAEANNLDPKLIHSMIAAESAYNAKAVSPVAEAKGLMQLMDATAKQYNVKDVFNPEENINAGSKYMADLLKRYDNNLEKALAAYNAGPTAVDKYEGIPPFTEKYVKKVIELNSKLYSEELKTLTNQLNKEPTKNIIDTGFSIGSIDSPYVIEGMKVIGKSAEKTNDNLNEIFGVINSGNTESDKSSTKSNTLLNSLLNRFGVMAAQGVGMAMGGDAESVGTGTNIGSVLGLVTAEAVPGIGTAAVTIGGMAGALLGGMFGGKKEEESLDTLKQIQENTAQLVEKLTPEILNAPANFMLPSGSGYTSNSSITINNNINAVDGSLSNTQIDTLANQLNEAYNRSTKSNSILG